MLKQLPNALTLLRLILAPVIAWLAFMGADTLIAPDLVAGPARNTAFWNVAAAIAFVVAALTDLFDGMLARALDAHSRFGRLIDPIADKALVGLPLIVVAIAAWAHGHHAWPVIAFAAAVIVVRDITMTWLRLASPDGEGMRVSSLAKIKTALELVAIGSYFVVTAGFTLALANDPIGYEHTMAPYVGMVETAWLALLLAAAALSAWTAYQYLAPRRPV